MRSAVLMLLLFLLPAGGLAATSTTPITLQAVPQLLASIEERLRGLGEALHQQQPPQGRGGAVRGAWGPGEQGVEALSRRLEAVETRLARLDTLIELRLDKLSETVGGRHMRDELAAEQLGRKVDAAAERINNKLGYLEARLDMASAKLAAKLEELPLEVHQKQPSGEPTPGHNCCHQLQAAMGASESRIRSQVERLNEQVRGAQAVTAQRDASGCLDATEQVHNLSRAIRDVLKTGRDKMLESLDLEAKNFGFKMTGVCNDLWRRSQNIEDLVKHSVSLHNITQRQIQEVARSGWHEPLEEPPGPDPELEELNNRLQRRMTELGRRLDSGFQMMMLAQNMFLENCHRIQLGEPQLEAHISLVLERMLDAVTNRSMTVNSALAELRDLSHGQSSQSSRSLSMVRNAVVKLSEQSNVDSKSIAKAIEHLGDLTADGISQVLSRMPSVESVANQIVLDLKPLLLSCSEAATTLSKLSAHNTSDTSSLQIELDSDSVTDHDELIEDPVEQDPLPPLEEYFSIFRDSNNSLTDLWPSMGANSSLTDLIKAMGSRDGNQASSSPMTLDTKEGNTTSTDTTESQQRTDLE